MPTPTPWSSVPRSAVAASAALPPATAQPVGSGPAAGTPAGALPLRPAQGDAGALVAGDAGQLLSSVLPRAPLSRSPVGPPASDPSNAELANYSATTSVAQVGSSNQTVVVGATDGSSLGLGADCVWTDGLSAAFRTNDGGQLWSTGWVGQNSSWTRPSSWSCGDFSAGEPSVAAGANGTVLYASIY